MKKLLILFTITSTIIAMHPMDKASAIIQCALRTMVTPPLKPIEVDLVHAEISRIGVPAMREKIKQIGFEYTQQHDDIHMTRLLEINTEFNRKDIQHDTLTATIFNTIDTIEQKSGYRPEHRLVHSDGIEIMEGATNYLGRNTRYFWRYVNGKRSSSIVDITAQLDNRNELQSIIASYQDQ